jgi:hypothetical protein
MKALYLRALAERKPTRRSDVVSEVRFAVKVKER